MRGRGLRQVDEWIASKAKRRVTEGTLRRYRGVAERAVADQRQHGRPVAPSSWTVADFDRLRARTVRSHWAFHVLLDFARYAGCRVLRDVSPPPRPSSGRVRWLDRATMEAIVRSTRTDPLRSLVTLLGLGCGLRRVEWRRLRVDDVELANGRMLIRGKGRGSPKLVWAPIHPALPSVWERFLEYRRGIVRRAMQRDPNTVVPPEALIHLSRDGLRAYTDSGLDRIVQRIGQRLPEGVRPGRLASHMLRRSAATLLEDVLLEQPDPSLDGVYRAVQQFLRHHDLVTTMRYLQGNPSRQRKALESYADVLRWETPLRHRGPRARA